MSPIARLYLDACLAELDALKPGNVHRHAPGHGMTVADFEVSARVSAPEIARQGAGVGARVLAAVTATLAAVGQNTNLGIVLLCAPLAAAAERPGPLSANLAVVLDGLDDDDARDVFSAIACANPGGLGAAAHDVRAAPSISLREAMALAAPRDFIARQYTNGFADVFGVAGADAQAIYLAFLAAHPDSHIARKFGAETAEAVRRDAAARLSRPPVDFAGWDAELKAAGINPGTSADLTVAALFTRSLASECE